MPRILHLGVGNFFRAHVANYTQDSPGWSITGVSFRSATIRNGLGAQDYNYTLVVKDAAQTLHKPITCLTDILVASDDIDTVIQAIASPDFDVITLTVTEKAYHLDADGRLNLDAPEVQADLQGMGNTVVGTLARGLAQRRTPITVLCCDNLPENGVKLARAVDRFAKAAHLTLTAYITFPSCMVDRITPATTDALRQDTNDPMAVPTEAFTEWVIENTFAAAKPDWPGAQWVDDVAPHEMRKLRMLNGAHSLLAYAGTVKGYTYVHEAVADPTLRALALALMAEAAATLPADVQAQAKDYADALMERFENPNLHHRLRQIAMDGSQKMPIRILGTLKDRNEAHSPALNHAIEAWTDFVRAEVSSQRQLDDPKAEALIAAAQSDDPKTALRTLIGA